MKTTLTLLLALASFCMQSQTLTWVDQLGGTLENVVNTMATDASGNVYTAGRFEGTMDADPGPGTLILTSVGGLDMFVTEVNSSGSLVWARQINGLNSSVYGDELFSIAVGASGSVYLTGRFSGTVDFDPGSGIFNLITLPSSEFCNPHKDIFILKLNPSGDFVWAEQVGGNGYDKVYAIALGSNESVHILGAYATLSGEPVDMDPGPGTYFLDSSFGASDFVLKLNADGTFVWAGLFSSNGGGGGQCGVRSTDIYPSSISVDGSDNLYVTGRLNGSADADPGPGTYTLAAVGGSNGFVFKWNSSGNFVWARQLTGAYCNVNDAAIDASGNVYTTGFFTGTVDFDPGTVTRNLKAPGSPGTSEIFVWKLNSSGNYMWAGQMGGNGTEEGSAIDLDGNNNIYTTGFFNGLKADFNPGTASSAKYYLNSAGANDVFISKLTSSGSFVWAVRLGGTLDDVGNGIEVDASNNVYTIGLFNGTADFDPTAGSYNLTTFGGRDSFIHKMSQPGAPPINSRPIESRSAISTKVFPNPTNGYSTLTLGQDAVDATIHIYNLSGQLLKSDIHVTGNNLKLDFSSYSPGMYMVEINDGNQSSIIKVMRVE